MGPGQTQPSSRTIIGVALLLFGAILLAVGMHHVMATGTCSSTGYNQYGPVPYCPKGTGWWIGFVTFGILLVVAGGLITSLSSAGLVIAGTFTAIGLGSLSIVFDSSASSGTRTFAAIFGGAFAVVGVGVGLAMAWTGIGRLSRSGGSSASAPAPFGPPPMLSAPASPTGSFGSTSPLPTSAFGEPSEPESAFGGSSEPDAIMGAYVASSSAQPPARMPSPSAHGPAGGDPLDKLTKLAALRDKGVLTEDEFNREKAKLLGEL